MSPVGFFLLFERVPPFSLTHGTTRRSLSDSSQGPPVRRLRERQGVLIGPQPYHPTAGPLITPGGALGATGRPTCAAHGVTVDPAFFSTVAGPVPTWRAPPSEVDPFSLIPPFVEPRGAVSR